MPLALLLALAAAPPHRAPPPAIQTITSPPPLVRMEAPPPTKYGDWTYDDEGDTIWAFTKNESGSVLGIVCGTTCVAYMNIQIQCEKDHVYLTLVSAPPGMSSITMKCRVIDKRPLFTVALNEDFIGLVKPPGQIGFALGMQSGKFQVSRFSLFGAFPAIEAVLSTASARLKDNGAQLKDFTY